jgi:hypothetical protein
LPKRVYKLVDSFPHTCPTYTVERHMSHTYCMIPLTNAILTTVLTYTSFRVHPLPYLSLLVLHFSFLSLLLLLFTVCLSMRCRLVPVRSLRPHEEVTPRLWRFFWKLGRTKMPKTWWEVENEKIKHRCGWMVCHGGGISRVGGGDTLSLHVLELHVHLSTMCVCSWPPVWEDTSTGRKCKENICMYILVWRPFYDKVERVRWGAGSVHACAGVLKKIDLRCAFCQ